MTRRLFYALLALLGINISIGGAAVWLRIDRTLTTLERAAEASERAARETEETMRAARKAFISEK